MHRWYNRLVLFLMLLFPAHVAQASLAAATAQAESPAVTLRVAIQPHRQEALAQAKPSQALLYIQKIEGISFQTVTPFTPEEIDKYPDYIGAFAQHAALNLGSDNLQDIASINYLVQKYPDIGVILGDIAKNYAGEKFNNETRKTLNRANRTPIMSRAIAAQVVKSTLTYGLVSAVAGRSIDRGLNDVNDRLLEARNEDAPFNIPSWNSLLRNTGDTLGNEAVGYIKKLPRTIPVALGTTALTNIILREFDERVGDLLPDPKYNPSGDNSRRKKYALLKYFLRNQALPFVISNFIVAPAVDAATGVAKDASRGELFLVNWASIEFEL